MINFRVQFDQNFQKKNAISKIFNYIKIKERILSPQINRKINHLHIDWNKTRWQNRTYLNHFRKLFISKLSKIDGSIQYQKNLLLIIIKIMIFAMNYFIQMKSKRFVIFIVWSNIFLISIRIIQPRFLNFEMTKKILTFFHDVYIISKLMCFVQSKRHLTLCTKWQYLILIWMIKNLKYLTNLRNSS